MIIAKKPTKVFNKKYGISFQKLFESLGKSAIMLSDDKPIGAAKELLSTISGVKISSSDLEGLAYTLIYKSIGATTLELFYELEEKHFIDETRETQLINSELTELSKSVEAALDNQIVIIDNKFFKNPGGLNILEPLLDQYSKFLKLCNVRSYRRIKILKVFRTRFVKKVNEEWLNNISTYSPLEEKFSTPFVEIIDSVKEWEEYYKYLKKEVDTKIFDESFSLNDIYIPLRAEKEYLARVSSTVNNKIYELVWLEEHLTHWVIKEEAPENYMRFISGGPGSGKSSFAKMWANTLAENWRYDVDIFFIKLQWFNIQGELSTSISKYISEIESQNFKKINPLNSPMSTKTLIIFDGLDELSQQGEFAERISGEFINLLERELSIRNGKSDKLYFLVTGRELTIQFNQEKIGDRFEVLKLSPYNITKDERSKYKHSLIASQDQRFQWWKKYAKLKGVQINKKDIARILQKLPEITSQPFLNYLVAWNMYDGGLKVNSINSLNVIYRNIINQVLNRRYSTLTHPATKSLNPDLFFQVLQEISISAWHAGDARIANYKDIQARLEDANLQEYSEVFNVRASRDTMKLLTTFYFRQHSFIGGQRKIEFTHKTFGEFLVATYLYDRIKHYFILSNLKMQFRNENMITMLTTTYKLVSQNALDASIFRFISDEIINDKDIDKKQFAYFLLSSFKYLQNNNKAFYQKHVEYRYGDSYRNFEEALFCIVSKVCETSGIKMNFEFDRTEDWGNWLHKINEQGGNDVRILNKNLIGLTIKNQKLFVHNFYKAKLRFSTYSNTNFSRSNFAKANLEHSTFTECLFIRTNLAGAKLVNSKFIGCRLAGADFRNTKLLDTCFDKCDLQFSDFSGTKLIQGMFNSVDLSYSNFRNSNLTFEMIKNSSCLYGAKGIDSAILDRIRKEKPKLLEMTAAYNNV